MSSTEFFGILAAIISVGVTVGLGLATLIIRGQHRTDARFDKTDGRLSGVETGLARVEGFLAGAGFAVRRDDASLDD